MKTILIIGALGFFIVSCAVRKSEPITGKQFVPANERIANGERVFMMHCQKCHPGGEGGLAPAINPNPAPQLIKKFQMHHGIGVMPGFKSEEILNKDLRDIIKFLKSCNHYI